MKKVLLLLLLGGLAATLPSHVVANSNVGVVVAGRPPTFAPPTLYGTEPHPAPLLHPPSSVTVPPTWRERSEWEKRRADQWSAIEWHRQEWRRQTGGDAPAGATMPDPALPNGY